MVFVRVIYLNQNALCDAWQSLSLPCFFRSRWLPYTITPMHETPNHFQVVKNYDLTILLLVLGAELSAE